ncbi:ATP-binding protein [Virgibacillus sp. SK37]|uniref:ATP-binding protein n=1 Tax=Virgibacillus sp. SK37 TaxID=403957 RepID=UPI0004D150DD|nr:ATP-binding protein [Virgibacillus sp. SK37]AIF44517.1 histidine kinase [Virgibacillus sp. SK37]
MVKKLFINKWSFIVILFLAAIILVRLLWMSSITSTFYYSEAPVASEGILDLQDWNFNDRQTLLLNGEWEFYPETFINPTEPNGEKPTYLELPTNGKSVHQDDHFFTYGTYRLRISLHNNDAQDFSLRINKLHNASTVFINGEQMGGSGQTAETAANHIGSTLPYRVAIPPEKNEVEIIIHYSSNQPKVGITKPIQFGTDQAINLHTFLSIGLQVLLVLVLILHSVYACILYFMRFRINKGMLYYTLLLTFSIVTVLGSDDKILFNWLSFSYEWEVKLVYLSYIGVGAFIPLVANQLFQGVRNKRLLKFFLIYCLLYALFVFISPSSFIYLTSRVLLSGVLLSSVFISLLNFDRKKIRIEQGIYLLLGCISIGNNLIWAIVINNNSSVMVHYPFDLIIALLCFTAFWFKRFFHITSKSEELTKKLQMENERKDEFLVNTSHELRNPLSGISNILQSVLEDKNPALHKEHQEALSTLLVISKRMNLMLNDLLDVTRLQEKTIHLDIKRTEIQPVISSVIEMTKLMFVSKNITLKLDIPDQFPAVMADENRLVQILFNLIHNAIKYTDEGTITIHATEKDDFIHLYIEDTGIGINEDKLDTIFEPYEQGDLNEKRASGGFGLGLSICKQLVELHHGTLTVQSTLGKGSIFTFTLPMYDETQERTEDTGQLPSILEEMNHTNQVAAHAYKEKAVKTSLHLLLVEDDPDNLNILGTILEKEGYKVTRESSAANAMEKLELESFDLVISDVMMPYVSGYELTSFIRERFTSSELPVLLLTAKTRREDVISGFTSGANDYVTKPIDVWELLARVHVLTELKVSIEERIRMEGAWLQSQIQPHFIFNTLNTISALSQFDVTKMHQLLEEFSHYLRLSFDFHNADPVVPLEQELSLVRSYLYIEQTRFGDRLTIEWDVEKDIDILIPPLSIQPLVENAAKHGVLQMIEGGKIVIRVKSQANHIEFTIHDNGKGIEDHILKKLLTKDHPFQGKGVGLRNVDRRLKQFYREGLTIQSNVNEGTTVSFTVPK